MFFVQLSFRNILVERSAKIYINKLHTSADAQNRLARLHKGFQQGEFRCISIFINLDRAVIFLTVLPGVDIAAAAKNQTVEAGIRLRQIPGNSFRTNAINCIDIILPIQRIVLAGQQKLHFFHSIISSGVL